MAQLVGWRALVVVWLLAVPAYPQPVGAGAETEYSSEEQAAQTFEAAVEKFRQANYAEAAQLFLEADAIAPSERAVLNAIAAARRANDQLLVVVAARRALQRSGHSSEFAASAREALVQAERHLSRLELTCAAPEPCILELNGTQVQAGTHHVLPGLQRIVASAGNRQEAKQLETLAGTTYRVALEPAPEPPKEQEALGPARSKTEQPSLEPHPPAPQARSLTALFWTSAAITAGLGALTVWSGVDTLRASNALPDPAPRRDIDKVKGEALRTDILLGATLLIAATTAYIGAEQLQAGQASLESANGLSLRF